MEGIDALEIDFEGSHQPRPLADDGRDALMNTLGLTPLTYRELRRTRVRPPAVNDGRSGSIASRSLDVHAVRWPGCSPGRRRNLMAARCSSTTRSPRLVRTTPSWRLGRPTRCFTTPCSRLRQVLAEAAVGAEHRKDGLWAHDATLRGVDGSSLDTLEQSGVIIPKVFRGLVEFHGDSGRNLADFTAWLADEKPEQIVDLDDDANFTHVDNIVAVNGSQVRMTRPPHRIVVVSAK